MSEAIIDDARRRTRRRRATVGALIAATAVIVASLFFTLGGGPSRTKLGEEKAESATGKQACFGLRGVAGDRDGSLTEIEFNSCGSAPSCASPSGARQIRECHRAVQERIQHNPRSFIEKCLNKGRDAGERLRLCDRRAERHVPSFEQL